MSAVRATFIFALVSLAGCALLPAVYQATVVPCDATTTDLRYACTDGDGVPLASLHDAGFP
jgi:hypothetical protein